MSIDALKARLPDYAKDLRLNLSNVFNSTNLTPQQVWGTAVASAIAARNADLVRAVTAAAADHLDETALNAAKAAAAVMGMNNIYYRFVHLSSTTDYAQMPARLRMNVIGNPGVDKLDFELWSLAVSAVNGCGMCIESHEREVVKKGAGKEAVQDTVRIASVIHAVAVTLDAEDALERVAA
ncbi:carboxymuconolactone decarboxylase family protein [Arenibaculum sp.]|jgi:alkyl hydroperoxide reductase subunit D|uniref:carboxymuconolactone decarboxylase family protein n=1 Tax=Arenibaculum sp. TaxID=2865862 RepID=UPI002E148C96|nr:carboxymuconolactone decarboxylase family protein [Arenibaculum sp.]